MVPPLGAAPAPHSRSPGRRRSPASRTRAPCHWGTLTPLRAFFHPPRRGPASGRQPAPRLPSAPRWRTPPAESFFHPRKTTVFSEEALFSLNKLRMRHRCNRPAVTCEQLARPRTSRKQPAPSPTVLCPDRAVAAWNLSSPLPPARHGRRGARGSQG